MSETKQDPRLADLGHFRTYPLMNGEIVNRLMGVGDFMHQYAAKRIIELEAEVVELRKDLQ